MGAEVHEKEDEYVIVLLIYQENVTADVALAALLHVPTQLMVTIFFIKWLPESERVNDGFECCVVKILVSRYALVRLAICFR